MLSILITFLPLIGAVLSSKLNLLATNAFAQFTTTTLVIISAVLSWYLFFTLGDAHYVIELAPWLKIGSFEANWALYIDSLTVLMFVVVNTVSAVVHLYSMGYMHNDPKIAKFFSCISLFTFCMLVLVSSNNFVQLFFGWEGVGLCSYLLIGFWFQKDSANNAAMKAFIVNRVGDFGLALGIASIYLLFDTVQFGEMFSQLALYKNHMTFGYHTITMICFLLFLGCMGKSAQIGLHTWLPDAMEGPTPVSALIHAATMVTAGIFLLVRCSPLFELAPIAREFIVIIGAITCLMAATIALVQQDIKKIIAYSTCSQLGYMFMACGLSAYGVAMFHLATHAFFKALLFLCAGNIIHSMRGEQNVDKMEPKLWRKLPITYSLMWIASLALAGIFPFAGFYSKDLILEFAYSNGFAFTTGMIVVLLTSFYSWRLIFKVFHSEGNIDVNAHESSRIMTIPLYLLGVLAVISGFCGENIFHITTNKFWHDAVVLSVVPHINYFDANMPILFSFVGILIAYFSIQYVKVRQALIPRISFIITAILSLLSIILLKSIFIFPAFVLIILLFHNRIVKCVVTGLLSQKYYFDQIYNSLFVKGIKCISNRLWQIIDLRCIDAFGPNGVAKVVYSSATNLVKLHTGFVFDYALAVLLGIISLIGLFVYIL